MIINQIGETSCSAHMRNRTLASSMVAPEQLMLVIAI